MREHWERSTPIVQLSQTEIDELLQPAFPGRHVRKFQLVEGGFANTSYKLEISGDGTPLFLRIFTRQSASGRKERALAELLAGRVPVSRFIDYHESNPISGHAYALQEWVEGTMLDRVLATADQQDFEAIGRLLGEVLAQIGAHTFSESGLLDGELRIAEPIAIGGEGFLAYIHKDLIEGIVGARLGVELTAELSTFLQANAALLDSVPGPSCLVHSDFGGSNILVRKEEGRWRIAGVVDWEFAFSGSSIFDIGHILRPPFGDCAPFESAIIEGYLGSGGRLPPCWKRASKLADLSAWVEFLSRPAPHSSVIATSREMIIRTMRDWETY